MSALANQERLMSIVLGPHVTEKGSRLQMTNNQVVFLVRPDSTKQEVRKAVELLFEVEVDKVRIVNCRGKIKRFGQTFGRRKDRKKAYVSLAEGHTLDFLGNE